MPFKNISSHAKNLTLLMPRNSSVVADILSSLPLSIPTEYLPINFITYRFTGIKIIAMPTPPRNAKPSWVYKRYRVTNS